MNQQLKYNISNNTNIAVGIRVTDEKITNDISVSNGGTTINSLGKEHNTDQNGSLSLHHRFSNQLKTSFRTYYTEYNAKQDLITITGAPYYDLLNHVFKRLENQTDWNINKKVNLIFGKMK